MKFILMLALMLIPPASAELLFDGTFKSSDHFDTGSFGAFGASIIDHNIITVMPANTLGREGYTTKWHMTADGEYTVYQNPIEPDNPVQYQLLFTDGTPLYISAGQEIWYGWSQYLNSAWKTSENSWEAVGMSVDAWNVGGYGLQFLSGTTDNYFIMNGNATPVPAFKMQTGKWYDIVYHIRWSYDSSGFVEVYLKDQYQTNYSLIYFTSNVQTRMQNEHDNIDMTLGISRSAKNTKDQIVYFMDPKIGTSMEDVVYGSPSYAPYPIVPPIAPAILPGLFDILKEKYITDISELPYSSGNPDVQWQQQGHIRAWVDIVGFKNLTKDNGIFFINGEPESMAIVKYDAEGRVSGYIDSITKSLSLSQSESNLIATLTVVLKWHVMCCDKDGCWVCGRFKETKTFQDVEVAPKRADALGDYTLNITEYNNTINPRTVLDLSIENLTYIDYVYKNESIKNYRKTARVEQTAKGVYFANLTTVNIWTAGTPMLHQMNDQVIIQKTASPDYPSLKVRISNLYETKDITNHSIIRDTYTIERTFNSLFFALIITFSVLIGMIVLIGKGIFK